MFVTLEGPEGAGKSTQLVALTGWLESQRRAVVATKNPGGTNVGAQIRKILLDPANAEMVSLTELLLYAADRAQHVEEVVKPALANGSVVLCDRYIDSTIAYQGHGRGIDVGRLRQLNELATGGLRPDLTLLLDLDVTAGLARVAASRQIDRLENEAVAFHERIRAGYLALAAAEPGRFVVVDAARSPDLVQQALRSAVTSRLGI
jgi:dTMP kinase